MKFSFNRIYLAQIADPEVVWGGVLYLPNLTCSGRVGVNPLRGQPWSTGVLYKWYYTSSSLD